MVIIARRVRALVLGTVLLLSGTGSLVVGAQKEPPKTSDPVRAQFDKVSRDFNLYFYAGSYDRGSASHLPYDNWPYAYRGSPYFFPPSRYAPYYYRPYWYMPPASPYGAGFAPYSGRAILRGAYPSPNRLSMPTGDRDAGRQDPYIWSDAPNRADGDLRGSPRDQVVPLSPADRITDLMLTAGVGVLIYVAAIGVLAQMIPKRLWAQVLEHNNVAIAIVLASVAIALGIIIATSLHW